MVHMMRNEREIQMEMKQTYADDECREYSIYEDGKMIGYIVEEFAEGVFVAYSDYDEEYDEYMFSCSYDTLEEAVDQVMDY